MSNEPLTGDRVAWVTVFKGNTSGLSAIHRYYAEGKTYCSRAIPPEPRRFQPLRSMHVCSRCAEMYARAAADDHRYDVARASA